MSKRIHAYIEDIIGGDGFLRKQLEIAISLSKSESKKVTTMINGAKITERTINKEEDLKFFVSAVSIRGDTDRERGKNLIVSIIGILAKLFRGFGITLVKILQMLKS